MRHPTILTLTFCVLAACGEDVSLGSRDDGESGAPDGGSCTVEAEGPLDMQCGNVMCNGASEYCAANTWPEPCKPLPCECASAVPGQQSCACLLKHIKPDCDAGATCTNEPSGLTVRCK